MMPYKNTIKQLNNITKKSINIIHTYNKNDVCILKMIKKYVYNENQGMKTGYAYVLISKKQQSPLTQFINLKNDCNNTKIVLIKPKYKNVVLDQFTIQQLIKFIKEKENALLIAEYQKEYDNIEQNLSKIYDKNYMTIKEIYHTPIKLFSEFYITNILKKQIEYNQNKIITHQFIKTFKEYIDWNNISEESPLNIDFIKKYIKNLNLYTILYDNLSLSQKTQNELMNILKNTIIQEQNKLNITLHLNDKFKNIDV